MAELYHLLQMLFSALLFLISCLGALGQFLYPWSGKTEQAPKKETIGMIRHNELTRAAGSQPLNGIQIEYPADMEKQAKEGMVILTCDVEVTGNTSNCHIMKSSGQNAFDDEALRYVRHARYQSALKNGVPVKEYAHQYTIRFKI